MNYHSTVAFCADQDRIEHGDDSPEGTVKGRLPRIADLKAMAIELQDDLAYRRLARTIAKASIVQSCLSDLRQAMEFCAALRAIRSSPRRAGTVDLRTTQQALLVAAVLFYARATATSSQRGDRGASAIAAKLDRNQLFDHEALVEIRNKAVAHVHSEALAGGEQWHNGHLITVELEGGWLPAAASRAVEFSGITFARLERQLPVAEAILMQRFKEITVKVAALLNDNPVSLAVFERHLIDPVATFGTLEAAADIVEGAKTGTASTRR